MRMEEHIEDGLNMDPIGIILMKITGLLCIVIYVGVLVMTIICSQKVGQCILVGIKMDPIGITIMIIASLIKVGFIIMLNGII